MNRNDIRTGDVLAPLLADFQLVGDGVERLLGLLTARSADGRQVVVVRHRGLEPRTR